MPRIGIVGAGAWGTALAVVAARAGQEVVLWGRNSVLVQRMAATRENAAYLPGMMLPEAVCPTADLPALGDVAALLLAVPAQQLRDVVRGLPALEAPLV